MTREELIAQLVEDKDNPTDTRYRDIDVNGVTLTVDTKKATGWHTFNILKRFYEEDGFDKLDYAFELIEYTTGVDAQTLIDSMGGDDAPYETVLTNIAEIVANITGKN